MGRDNISKRSVSEVRLLLLLLIERNKVEGGCFCCSFHCCAYILLDRYILKSSSNASKPKGRRGCRQFVYRFDNNIYHYCNPLCRGGSNGGQIIN